MAQHSPHRWWRVSTAKDAPALAVPAADLPQYPFFRPNHAEAWQVIVVDIDRPDAMACFTAADIPRPQWIIETDKGAQAGWLIEDVSTRAGASEKAQAYAEAVALRLRHTLGGDRAVHPLRAHKVRNPLYGPLVQEGRLHAFRTAPYPLWQLHRTLEAAGRWVRRIPGESARPQAREYWGRNDEVNSRAWQTVRRELEAGKRGRWTEAQVLDLVRTLGMEAAANHAKGPLPGRALEHIAASITRYQHRPGSRRRTMHGGTFSAEQQAKGGSANTTAQRRQRQERAAKGTAVRSANKAMRDEEIRIMRWEQGKTNAEIAAALRVSIDTVKRAVRGSSGGGCISGVLQGGTGIAPVPESCPRTSSPAPPAPRCGPHRLIPAANPSEGFQLAAHLESVGVPP